MSFPLTLISQAPAIAPEPIAPEPIALDSTSTPEGTFHGVMESAIQGVTSSQNASSQATERFLAGEGGDLHTTILAAQRATLSFDLFLQVRNKVVSAYQEIMRMQV
jgi:flagellar hook-basal body complex protein FliE